MDEANIRKFGDMIYEAYKARTTIAPLIAQTDDIEIEDSYRIAKHFIDRRVEAGERIIGKKIGVTSKPVQEALGVFQPDFGQLTNEMVYENGAAINLNKLIQPKAEAELAFVLKEDLVGPGITAVDVIRATDYVTPCFEIVDSRITDWKIGIKDTIADNASCGVFALGDVKGDPRKVDLTLAGMVVEMNGELHATSTGAAVQGSPANAVAWLANTLGELGMPFRAGEIILSGSQGPLIPVVAGDRLKCTIGGLGTCEISFEGKAAV